MSQLDLSPLEGHRAAVIGGGIAGLTAARKLARAGAEVTIVERADGAGGRLGALVADAARADCGAQYFTAREPAFKAWVARAKAEGAVDVWSPRGKTGDEEWLVGVPAMGALLRSLAESFDLSTGREVVAVSRVQSSFSLGLAAGESLDGFDLVVVATPPRAALHLLAPHGAPFDRIAAARTGPCWTVLVDLPEAGDGGDDIRRNLGPLAWVARAASRPGRSGSRWILQATPAWSAAEAGTPAEEVAARQLAALTEAIGDSGPAAVVSTVFWPEALTETAVGEPFLLAADGRLGCCGDYLIAPRVEAAWASADQLADAMIAAARTRRNG